MGALLVIVSFFYRILSYGLGSAEDCQFRVCWSFNCQGERENYAEKGGDPFLHMLREWAL